MGSLAKGFEAILITIQSSGQTLAGATGFILNGLGMRRDGFVNQGQPALKGLGTAWVCSLHPSRHRCGVVPLSLSPLHRFPHPPRELRPQPSCMKWGGAGLARCSEPICFWSSPLCAVVVPWRRRPQLVVARGFTSPRRLSCIRTRALGRVRN